MVKGYSMSMRQFSQIKNFVVRVLSWNSPPHSVHCFIPRILGVRFKSVAQGF